MPLTLTQLASDNFDYVSNPLPSPPWAKITGTGLEALGGYCQDAVASGGEFEGFTGQALPNDQYAEITFKNIANTDYDVFIGVRTFGNNTTAGPGYYMYLAGNVIGGSPDSATLLSNFGDTELITVNVTPDDGDTFALAVVGNTIYMLQNGTVFASVDDTQFSSGSYAVLGIQSPSAPPFVQVSNFAVGSASASSAPSGDLPFLGSVVEVSSPDAGKTNPFLGTFKVVSAAPGNQSVGQRDNPYLGHIKVVTNPPASYDGTNPVLGEVVVLDSVPAGALDVWLGSAETS